MSVQISVSDEFKAVVDKIQKFKGYESVSEACDYIGQVFTSRFKAVQKYTQSQKDGKPAKKKAKAKAKKAA